MSNPFEDKLSFLKMRDGIHIAQYVFEPSGSMVGNIVVFHCSDSDSTMYFMLAIRLSKTYNFRVVLFDRRGHGRSEGTRGYLDYIDQNSDDVHEVLSDVMEKYRNYPLYITTHCVGISIFFNYLIYSQKKGLNKSIPISGYVFISPVLYSRRDRKHSSKNKKGEDRIVVHYFNFFLLSLLNKVHIRKFNYLPCLSFERSASFLKRFEKIIDVNKLVSHYSYYMSINNTIDKSMSDKIKLSKPVMVFLGDKDPFVTLEEAQINIGKFVCNKGDAKYELIEGKDHFDICLDIGRYIGPWLSETLRINESGI